MSIARKISAGLLSLAILGTATGCMPSPFEQDVPSTQWTTDKDGNRVKVSSSESKELSTPQQIQATVQDYYKATFSKEMSKRLQVFSEDVQAKQAAAGVTKSKPTAEDLKKMRDILEPVTKYLYQGEMSDQDFLSTIGALVFVSGMMTTGGDVKVEVPLSAIRVKGDTATVNMSEMKATVNGKEAPGQQAGGNEEKFVNLVLKDGQWLIDAKKLSEQMGVRTQ